MKRAMMGALVLAVGVIGASPSARSVSLEATNDADTIVYGCPSETDWRVDTPHSYAATAA